MMNRKKVPYYFSACIVIILSVLVSVNTLAIELSREEKIKQYEILHGNDPVNEKEEIRPAQKDIPYTPVNTDDLSLFQTDQENLSLNDAVTEMESLGLTDDAAKEVMLAQYGS